MIYTLTLNPSIDYIVSLDEVKFGELNRIQEEHFLTGGKGINVSRVLNSLIYESTALGFIGGFSGQFVQDELVAAGIYSDFIEIDEPTRINIKLKTATETEINGQGPAIPEDAAQALLTQMSGLEANDLVIIAGSKARNLPIDYYQQIIQVIKAAGAEFVIDTTGQELRDALSQQPFLVKPNDVELAELYGVTLKTEADYVEYGQRLIDDGARFAIVSLGGAGAIFFSEDGVYRGYSPEGQVINTVGAGDSMVAGFVGTYRATGDLLTAFKFGLASGSATAFTEDLAAGPEIKALVTQVKLTKIN